MLELITFTGADDTVEPRHLCDVSDQHQHVEWGILVSLTSEGHSRFPSRSWIKKLLDHKTDSTKLAMHISGGLLRELMIGSTVLLEEFGSMLQGFDRFQLNFHGEPTKCVPIKFVQAINKCIAPEQEVIFQIDGNMGEALLTDCLTDHSNGVPLFDLSHGAGVLPDKWPAPRWVEPDLTPDMPPEATPNLKWKLHGYAGGIGTANVMDQVNRIEDVADGAPFWIDMETSLRTPDDRFSLAECGEVIRKCRPFMGIGVDSE